MNRKLFCSFKGYGDFVVSCRFLRDLPKTEYRMLAARHLEPIYHALGSPVDVKWIDLTKGGRIPAVFDIRLQGLPAAVRSVFDIRRAIRQTIESDDVLMMELVTARERAFTWPRVCEQVGRPTPNIYRSYARYFGCEISRVRLRKKATQVAIFPDARLPHRILPESLLTGIRDECASRQLDVRAVRVGKGGGSSDVPVEWIDGFDALVAAIRSADIVVSSDSLPGHIAEYFGIPVFVFVPQWKDYWMPGSAYETKGFAKFGDTGALGRWLEMVQSTSLELTGLAS